MDIIFKWGGHSNRRINYDLFREIVEDNPNITNAELAEKFSIHIDTVRRLRKRLGLPKRKYEYELSLSKIYAHKSEIIQQYSQNFSISIISKKLNVDEELLAKVVNDEWKMPKHQHIYKNNKSVLLYDKKDGHFVELTTKADIIEKFGHFFRFSSLDNKRKSDLGFVVRFYKEDFPLALKKLESGWFEFWEEEG